MLEKLKEEVFKANMLLPEYDLVKFTWGNVSGIDRESGYIVIKPSGVEYASMTAEDMVVVDYDGNVIDKRRYFEGKKITPSRLIPSTLSYIREVFAAFFHPCPNRPPLHVLPRRTYQA